VNVLSLHLQVPKEFSGNLIKLIQSHHTVVRDIWLQFQILIRLHNWQFTVKSLNWIKGLSYRSVRNGVSGTLIDPVSAPSTHVTTSFLFWLEDLKQTEVSMEHRTVTFVRLRRTTFDLSNNNQSYWWSIALSLRGLRRNAIDHSN